MKPVRDRRARDKPALRPRWPAWVPRIDVVVAAPILISLWPVIALCVKDHIPVLGAFSVLGAVALAAYAAPILWEYRTRPPVMRFWIEDPGFALTVREQRSGKVLLKSATPSLAGRDLSDSPLQGANLRGVDLRQVDLSGRDLSGADLRGARLNAARLVGADLRGANLEGAVLSAADLHGADLRHARLANAALSAADFSAADLRGADFVGRGATRVIWNGDLGGARFEGACHDSATRWPAGFDHFARGCLYGPELAGRLPIPAEATAADLETLPVPSQRVEGAVE